MIGFLKVPPRRLLLGLLCHALKPPKSQSACSKKSTATSTPGTPVGFSGTGHQKVYPKQVPEEAKGSKELKAVGLKLTGLEFEKKQRVEQARWRYVLYVQGATREYSFYGTEGLALLCLRCSSLCLFLFEVYDIIASSIMWDHNVEIHGLQSWELGLGSTKQTCARSRLHKALDMSRPSLYV